MMQGYEQLRSEMTDLAHALAACVERVGYMNGNLNVSGVGIRRLWDPMDTVGPGHSTSLFSWDRGSGMDPVGKYQRR